MPVKFNNSYIYLLLIVVIISLLGLILYKALDNDPRVITSPLINKKIPSFELPTLADPNQLINNQSLLGKPFILNVWASWCASCQIEHPLIMELAQKHQITIIGMNYKDQRHDAMQWLTRLQNPYALNLYDPDGRVSFDFGVYGAPETFIIDADGIIRYKYAGPITRELVANKLLPLINELSNDTI